jgi:hypothetical protein
MVSAVRTARALSRAFSKQLRIEDGLAVEKARNRRRSLVGLVVEFEEGWRDSRRWQRRFPFVGCRHKASGSAVRRSVASMNAREIFGAFDVAGEPEQVIGGARQHAH